MACLDPLPWLRQAWATMRCAGRSLWWSLLVVLLHAPQASAAPSEQPPTYVIESIEIEGNSKTKDYVIRRALQVRPGERLSVDDPRFEITRFRVLALGFFSDVRLKLRKGRERGHVVLVVRVVERGTIVLTEIYLGTSEATSAWGGLGVAENNFLGQGIAVEGAFLLGADPNVERGALQQSYRLRFSSRQLPGVGLSVSTGFRFVEGSEFFRKGGPESSSNPDDYLSVRYQRIGGSLGVGMDIARYLRLFLDYRGERIEAGIPEGAARREPDGGSTPIAFGIRDGTSVLSSVTLMLERDTRSDPLLPQSGSLLQVSSQLSGGLLGSSYDFVKIAANYNHFFGMPWGHVLSLQTRGGMVFGQAPFFERFFIGDFTDLIPGRALGLNFSTLPSRDVFGTSIDSKRYEEFAIRLGVEYIIPWFRGGHYAYGGDFFLNVGLLSLTSRRELRVRDRPLHEAIPVDMTVDAGLRLDTFIGIFRISIGNFLGRIPF